jgi:hypothetical protein
LKEIQNSNKFEPLFENISEKFEEFRLDQQKFRDEMTKTASTDMVNYIKTQIQQIKERLPEQPMFSRKGLSVCASCHQVVGD